MKLHVYIAFYMLKNGKSYNTYNGRMDSEAWELLEMAKLIALIKEKALTNFISIWKALWDFLLKIGKMKT